MNEKLKKTLEVLWQDQKDMVTVLSVVGVGRFIETLRQPAEIDETPMVYRMGPASTATSGQVPEAIYSKAA